MGLYHTPHLQENIPMFSMETKQRHIYPLLWFYGKKSEQILLLWHPISVIASIMIGNKWCLPFIDSSDPTKRGFCLISHVVGFMLNARSKSCLGLSLEAHGDILIQKFSFICKAQCHLLGHEGINSLLTECYDSTKLSHWQGNGVYTLGQGKWVTPINTHHPSSWRHPRGLL